MTQELLEKAIVYRNKIQDYANAIEQIDKGCEIKFWNTKEHARLRFSEYSTPLLWELDDEMTARVKALLDEIKQSLTEKLADTQAKFNQL